MVENNTPNELFSFSAITCIVEINWHLDQCPGKILLFNVPIGTII